MKEEIDNISFAEYIALEDRSDYDFILRYSEYLKKPLDLFEIGELTNYSFGFVKDIQEVYNYEGMDWDSFIKYMADFTQKSKVAISKNKVFDMQRARVYLCDQVSDINQLESVGLSGKVSSEQAAAGIDRFEKYRSFIQFDTLASGDITKFDKVRNIPYLEAFTKLKLEADRAAFNSDYTNLINKKL